MKQRVKAQTEIIRFGIRLSAVPCKRVNESSSSTHCWTFLDQPIRPPALEKESPASNSLLFYFHTCQEIHTFYFVPAQNSQRDWHLRSTATVVDQFHDSCTTLALDFSVDIRSCAKDEGEPFVISEFHCNLFDPIRPEHSDSHHRLPSQQERPPAH